MRTLGFMGQMRDKPVETKQRKDLKKIIVSIIRKKWTVARRADALADIFAMETFKYINLTNEDEL